MPLTRVLALIVGLFLSASIVSLAQETERYRSPESDFLRAEELYQLEKYKSAQRFFKEYLKSGEVMSKRTQAEYYIAVCALYLEQAEAEYLINEFVKNHPNANESQTAYYQIGNYYFDKKQYPEAIKYYSKSSPSHLSEEEKTKRQFNLGYSYFTQKQIGEAEPLFDQVKAKENKYQYAAYYYSGYIKFKQENYQEALNDFKTAGEHPTYKSIAPYMIVQILYKTEEYKSLTEYADEVLKSKQKLSNKAEIILLTADAHYKLEEFEECIPLFEAYLSVKKSADSETYYRLGYAYIQTGDYEKAAASLKNISLSNDSLGQYGAFYLGTAYIKTGNLEYAENAFSHASACDFNLEIKELSHYNLIKLYYDNEQFDQLLTSCESYLELYPQGQFKAEVNTLLTEGLYHSKNYDRAITYIEGLSFSNTKTKSVYQEVCYEKGVTLFNSKEYKASISYFNKSLSTSQNKELEIDTYFWKAEAFSVQRKLDSARYFYTKVISALKDRPNRTYYLATYGIAYIKFYQKEYPSSKSSFDFFVAKTSPQNFKSYYGDALLRIADISYYDKNYSAALKKYDEAINAKTQAKDYAYYQKGVVLAIQNGKTEEAKNNLRVVTEKYPESVYRSRAYYKIAQISFENAQYDNAIKEFSQFIKVVPNHKLTPMAYMQRGLSYYNKKEYAKALADYDYILTNYCQEKVGIQALSLSQQVLAKLDRSKDYKKRLADFEECNPDNEELEDIKFNVAVDYFQAFDMEEAIKSFTAFVNKYPNSSHVNEANYYLGSAYYAQKDLKQAQNYFEQVYENGPEEHLEKSLLRLGRITNSNQDYTKSIKYNKALLTVVKSERKQVDGLIGLVEAYYNTAHYDSCLIYIGAIQNNAYARSYIKEEAKLYKVKISYERKLYEQTAELGLDLAETAGDRLYGVQGKYFAGLVYYEQEKYDSALVQLRALNKDFSDQTHWVGESYLLIAKCFIAMDEKFQAEATLTSIIDNFPEKETKDKAATLLATLEEEPVQDTSSFELEEVELDSMLLDSNTVTKPMEIEVPSDSLNSPNK